MQNNKVTLHDIARELNISINSVSLALRNRPGLKSETRKLILSKAKEMGYISKALENQNIFVISSAEHVSDNYFYTQLLQIIEKLIVENGYNMLISQKIDAWAQNGNLSKKLKDYNVTGILMLGDLTDNEIEKILSSGIPSIALGFYANNSKMNVVIEDNISGMFQIVNNLKSKGYSKIGFIGAKDVIGLYERFMGFLGAAIQCGFEINPEFINVNLCANSDSHYDELLDYFNKLKDLPEVFVFCHDRLAIIGMKVLFGMGIRTPRDIGLVGFDNSEMARLSIPSLATVEVFPEEQAKQAVQCLISLIENPNSTFHKIIIPVEFVNGGSLR